MLGLGPRRAAVGFSALAAALALATPAAANHSTLEHVSLGPAGGNGASTPVFGRTSSDGTRAFFATTESLVAGDTDSSTDVYERVGTTTTLISTGPDGGNGAITAMFRDASSDGTRVFFATQESLVAADTDTLSDIYERAGGTTTLISIGPAGGNGFFQPTFGGASSDGSRVFFATTESLVAADTDASTDVYERASGTTTLISTGPAGGNGALNAQFHRASSDGSRVLFSTPESLVAADTDSVTDLYERTGGTTTQISTGPAGGNGADAITFAGASSDGTRVLFLTVESLVATDTDTAQDLYERTGATTTQISTGPAGGNGAFAVTFGGASSDGTRVFFSTNESLVASDLDTAQDVYERAGITTTLISTGPAGGNGTQNAGFSGASSDGTRLFFNTSESLVVADTDTLSDIYERAGGTTTLISIGPAGGNGGLFTPSFNGTSSDGTRVFFSTIESLVAADTDIQRDIYERFSGATTLLSFGLSGGNGNANADFRGASADGTRVFFTTTESLVASDLDTASDIYVAGIANTANFPRPGGATPLRAPLVPVYRDCAEPNSVHPAPLTAWSCNPPQMVSDFLTMGTNGQFVGSVRIDVALGNPGPPDEADLNFNVIVTDVRRKSDGLDYTGELQVSMGMQITDRLNGPNQADPATAQDITYAFSVPCTTTGGAGGSNCNLTTSADTLTAGSVTETKRSIFDLGKIQVFDGGPDGDADTVTGNTLFATQGVFVP